MCTQRYRDWQFRRAALVGLAILLLSSGALAQEQPRPPSGSDAGRETETETETETEEALYQPAVIFDEAGNPIDPCGKFDAQYDSWLDRSQLRLYRTVCGTAAWFDGFFGDSRYDEKTGDTYGRFSMGGFYDRRDRFDEVVRLRAKYAFVAARKRASIFIRQGDEDSVVEERGGEASDRAVEALARNEDSALFAGFGFDRRRNLERGFSLRLGAKLRTPIETFAKVRYRYGWRATDDTLIRLRPVVYWKSDERFGATLGIQVDNFINDKLLLRWDNSGNVTQDPDVRGMRWDSALILFQALSAKRALTYSTFVSGQTEADSKLQNYGFELKFRHRFLRDWLFLEYVGSASWPRETLLIERKFNPGVGLRFEAYFGPHPEDALR